VNLLRKSHFGQISRSNSLNRNTIRLIRSKNLTQNDIPSLRFPKSDRLLEDLDLDLDKAEQQIQELKTCPTGKLKLNTPMSFGTQFLTRPIASFAEQYPEVELEVDFDDRWADVVGQGYDVVIRIGSLKTRL
jgi:hypothetical protein